MQISRISDSITGETIALGTDLDAEAVFGAWAAQHPGADEAELREVFYVEDDLDEDDLSEQEWAQVVAPHLADGGHWQADGVTVWMPHAPAGLTGQQWPSGHGGVAVHVDGEDDEQIYRPVHSWSDLRAEVRAARERITRRAAQQDAERAQRDALAAVGWAADAVRAAEEALAAARARRDAAMAQAVLAGATRTRVAREAGLSAMAVTKLLRERQ